MLRGKRLRKVIMLKSHDFLREIIGENCFVPYLKYVRSTGMSNINNCRIPESRNIKYLRAKVRVLSQ
jgi:hypothetical protein